MMALLACGPAEPAGPSYHRGSEWLEGVNIVTTGRTEAVDSATVLFADDLPGYASIGPELKEDGVAVVQPGRGAFDTIVFYRTGGFCGFIPDVSITGDTEEFLVEITTPIGDDCPAMEYDAAVGLEFSPSFERATVVGTHSLGDLEDSTNTSP